MDRLKDTTLIDTLIDHGFYKYCLVADSIFSTTDQYLMDLAADGKIERWVVPSERSIPAVAAGVWLATGEHCVMLMQNSGFSNAMDYLRTVLGVHQIPGLVLSSWRGHDALLDDSEPHIVVGNQTLIDCQNTLGAEHVFGQRNGENLYNDLLACIADVQKGHLSCLLVSPDGFEKTYPLRTITNDAIPLLDYTYYETQKNIKGCLFTDVCRHNLLTREEALLKIVQETETMNPFYIVGNGYNPRVMQALQLSEYTFENAGGMGSSLGIAWGAACSNPHQVFIAIDGDQNATMNEMEKVLCSHYPENLYWYIINNGSGESVGPSLSLPLSPWHYDLARVIHTSNEAPNSFAYQRINASGLKYQHPEAKQLAEKIGNLPAQAHRARQLIQNKKPF